MASPTSFISFLFLATLFISVQINARESHFFSKVTPHNNDNNDNNGAKETELSNKEAFVTVSKHDQEPTFIPESENYGLYGHESGQLPPSATTPTKNGATYTAANTYIPYKAENVGGANKYTSNNNNNYYYDKDAYAANHNSYYTSKDSYDANRNGAVNNAQLADSGYSSSYNNYYFNKDAYDANLNDQSNTKLTETSHNGMSDQNNRYYYNSNGANKFNVERQGMSDTRFLEGGRYYVHVDPKKFNPTMYGNSREVDTRFSNKNGYYPSNQNLYEDNNSAYQNQAEFEDDQDEFQP